MYILCRTFDTNFTYDKRMRDTWVGYRMCDMRKKNASLDEYLRHLNWCCTISPNELHQNHNGPVRPNTFF